MALDELNFQVSTSLTKKKWRFLLELTVRDCVHVAVLS